jgi:Rod binding domain-containing protein
MTFSDRIRPRGGLAEPQQPAGQPRTIAQAARQFEALLIEHLLKMMREATQPESEKKGAAETYREIAGQQLACALAASGGLGIAGVIERDLGKEKAISPSISADKLERAIAPAKSMQPKTGATEP